MKHHIRPYRDGDESAIVDLLNRSFGRSSEYASRSEDWWRWKYSSSPAGFRTLVAQDDDGHLVGHYGSVVRPLAVNGRRRQMAEVCDSCVDQNSEPGLSRGRILQDLVRVAVTSYRDWGPYSGAYGLPVPVHFDLGSKRMEYWMLRTQPVLVGKSMDRLPAQDTRLNVEHVDRCPADLDDLFDRHREEEVCVGWRDVKSVDWRFAARPETTYHGAVCRDPLTNRPRGMAWYRCDRFLGSRRAVIVDWIVPIDDVAAGAALLWWATWRASNDGLDEVMFLCPPAHTWSIQFQNWGFHLLPTDYVFVFIPFEADLPSAWVRRHWFYTFADTDIL